MDFDLNEDADYEGKKIVNNKCLFMSKKKKKTNVCYEKNITY